MKYIVAVLVIIVGIFLSGGFLKSPRLPFAHSEPLQAHQLGGVLQGGCTEKYVKTYGFPFRTNTYDECEQDESTHVVAAVIDIVFLGLMGYIAYWLVSKRNHRAIKT